MSSWLVKSTTHEGFLRDELGWNFGPILGAYAFKDKGEASLYAERNGNATVIPNPFHRCPGCGIVSQQVECDDCYGDAEESWR